MKFLLLTKLFIIFALCVLAKGDPRAISFDISYLSSNYDSKLDTSKSIVVYGARDDKGVYKIEGVDLGLSFEELKKVLIRFYRDFPENAKSNSKGFEGLTVPKPNILYKSLSWAETKNDGRDLVTKIAKEENVSLFYFNMNLNYAVNRKKDGSTPDYSTTIIDYYDTRMREVSIDIRGKIKKNESGRR